VGITLSQADDASQVRLDGVIDISVAAELKEALGRAIREGRPMRIAVEGVTGFDVTAFQLLRAARREAGEKGIEFRLTGKMAESMQSFLESVGLADPGTPE
jgi:anti-anti-sigma factor